MAGDTSARGDGLRLRRIKKVDRHVLKKKGRLKSIAGEENTKRLAAENSNPFLDSPSSSDGNEADLNPFENGAYKKSSFLIPSEQKVKSTESDAKNPFLDEFSDQNDVGGDHLLDGLASYEDELINYAANSFIPNSGASESSPKKSQSRNETLEVSETVRCLLLQFN